MSSVMPRELIRWLQTLDLPFAVKNPKRDLCNGYNVAEICSRYWRDVDLRQFDNGTSTKVKESNWSLLKRIFAKHDATLPDQLIADVIRGTEGSANSLLEALYSLLTGRQIVVVAPTIEADVPQVPQFNRNLGAAQQQIVDAMLKEAALQAQEESRRQQQQADEDSKREAADRAAAQRRAQEAANRKPKVSTTTQKVQAIRPVTADEAASAESGAATAPVTFSAVTVKALPAQALSRLGYAAASGRGSSAGRRGGDKGYDGGNRLGGVGGAGSGGSSDEGVLLRISQTIEQTVSELTIASWPISPGSNYLEYLAMNAAKIPVALKTAIWEKISATVSDISEWLLSRPHEAGVFLAVCSSAVSTAAVQAVLGRAHYPFVGSDAVSADAFALAVMEAIAAKNAIHASHIAEAHAIPLCLPAAFTWSAAAGKRKKGVALLFSLLPKPSFEALEQSLLRTVRVLCDAMLQQQQQNAAAGGAPSCDSHYHAGLILTLERIALTLPQVRVEMQERRAAQLSGNQSKVPTNALGHEEEDEDDNHNAYYSESGAAAHYASSSSTASGGPSGGATSAAAVMMSAALTKELLHRATAALYHSSATVRLAAIRLLKVIVERGSDDELDCAMLLQQLHPIAPQTLSVHVVNHVAVVGPLVALAGSLLSRCVQQIRDIATAIETIDAKAPSAADENPFAPSAEQHVSDLQNKISSLQLVVAALEKILVHASAPPSKATAQYTPLSLRCTLAERIVIADVVACSLPFVASAQTASTLATQALQLMLSVPAASRHALWSPATASPSEAGLVASATDDAAQTDANRITATSSSCDPARWSAIGLATPLVAAISAQPQPMFIVASAGATGSTTVPNVAAVAPAARVKALELLELLCHIVLRPATAPMATTPDEVPQWWELIKKIAVELGRAAAFAPPSGTSSSSASTSGGAKPNDANTQQQIVFQLYALFARRFISRCYVDLSGSVAAPSSSLESAPPVVVLPSPADVLSVVGADGSSCDGPAAAALLGSAPPPPADQQQQQQASPAADATLHKAMQWWKTVVMGE